MDKSAYAAAIAAINDADKETLAALSTIVTDFNAALEDAKTKVAAIVADYPATDYPAIGARVVLDNTASQLQSCTWQTQAMTQNVAMGLAQYAPAPAPATTPPTN